MLDPFSKGFKVTPKGLARDKFNYNWQLAFPLIFLLVASTLSFSICLLNPPPGQSLNLGLFWSGYNVLTLSAALLTLLDIPKFSLYEWFDDRSPVQIKSGDRLFWGTTSKLSEEGIEILLPTAADLAKEIDIELVQEKLTFRGYVARTLVRDNHLQLIVKFTNLSLAQHRSLVEILYCRPDRWQKKSTPGELKSVWILLQLLFRPLKFFRKKYLSSIFLKMPTPSNFY